MVIATRHYWTSQKWQPKSSCCFATPVREPLPPGSSHIGSEHRADHSKGSVSNRVGSLGATGSASALLCLMAFVRLKPDLRMLVRFTYPTRDFRTRIAERTPCGQFDSRVVHGFTV